LKEGEGRRTEEREREEGGVLRRKMGRE